MNGFVICLRSLRCTLQHQEPELKIAAAASDADGPPLGKMEEKGAEGTEGDHLEDAVLAEFDGEDQSELLGKPLILLRDLHAASSFEGEAIAIDDKAQLEKLFERPIDAFWIKTMEKSLETLVWMLYAESCPEIEKHCVYVADAKAAGVKDKVMLTGLAEGMDLMFAGPVTTSPTKDSKLLATIAGIEFFVMPPPSFPAGDICVPAWLAKPTSKQELVTLKPNTLHMDVYVVESGQVYANDPSILSEGEKYRNKVVKKNFELEKELAKESKKHDRAVSLLAKMIERSDFLEKEKLMCEKAAKSAIEELQGQLEHQKSEIVHLQQNLQQNDHLSPADCQLKIEELQAKLLEFESQSAQKGKEVIEGVHGGADAAAMEQVLQFMEKRPANG